MSLFPQNIENSWAPCYELTKFRPLSKFDHVKAFDKMPAWFDYLPATYALLLFQLHENGRILSNSVLPPLKTFSSPNAGEVIDVFRPDLSMRPLTRIGDNRTCTQGKTTQAHLRMSPKTRKKTRMPGFIRTEVWTKRHMNARRRRMLLTRSAILQAEEWVTGLNSNQEQWRETSAGRGAKLSPLIRSRSENINQTPSPGSVERPLPSLRSRPRSGVAGVMK